MKSYLHGRKAATSPALSGVGANDTPRGLSCVVKAPKSGPSPVVDVVREGDKITRIVVLCSCGEKIEIDCLYSP